MTLATDPRVYIQRCELHPCSSQAGQPTLLGGGKAMTPEERAKYAKEKANESAKKLLEEMPEDVRKGFKKETF